MLALFLFFFTFFFFFNFPLELGSPLIIKKVIFHPQKYQQSQGPRKCEPKGVSPMIIPSI